VIEDPSVEREGLRLVAGVPLLVGTSDERWQIIWILLQDAIVKVLGGSGIPAQSSHVSQTGERFGVVGQQGGHGAIESLGCIEISCLKRLSGGAELLPEVRGRLGRRWLRLHGGLSRDRLWDLDVVGEILLLVLPEASKITSQRAHARLRGKGRQLFVGLVEAAEPDQGHNQTDPCWTRAAMRRCSSSELPSQGRPIH
jgi:hypothetical protein